MISCRKARKIVQSFNNDCTYVFLKKHFKEEIKGIWRDIENRINEEILYASKRGLSFVCIDKYYNLNQRNIVNLFILKKLDKKLRKYKFTYKEFDFLLETQTKKCRFIIEWN